MVDAAFRSRVLYLDQNYWIALAKCRSGLDTQWWKVLELIETLVADGKVVCPLAPAHYLETWHRADQDSRERLGATMRDVSGFATIPSPYVVRRIEVAEALGATLPLYAQGIDIGYGAGHAFGRPSGRFRFVASLATQSLDGKEGPEVAPPPEWETIPCGEDWEWYQLVGTPELLQSKGVDRTPEHRHGSAYQDSEMQLRKALAENPRLMSTLSELLAREEVVLLSEEIERVATILAANPREWFTDPDGNFSSVRGREFLRKVPSAYTWASLRYWHHRNLSLPIEQHDWVDLGALSVAIPYADVVVTEKRWAHIANASGLARQFGRTVISGLTALNEWLHTVE